MLSLLYMWTHSCGICSLRFVFQKKPLIPRVTVQDRVSCTALELFCRAHGWECALLWVVWKNELPLLFMVCLLRLFHFAERGDEACIDQSIAAIPTPVSQGHCVPRSAQERSGHAGCFCTFTAPELVEFNWKISFSAVRGRYCVPEEC